MDFGKVNDPDQIDFALPPLSARSERLLQTAAAARPPGEGAWLRLGAPAWARRDWLGTLYPHGTDPADFLTTYARKAGAIELNATYYKLPDETTIRGWADQTPPAFHFCPKLGGDITHEHALVGVEAATARFADRIRALGPRLGPTLVQLGPDFAPDRLPHIAALLARWPGDLPLALEVRHAAWFRDGALRDDLAALLQAAGASAAITDVAGRRDVCHATLSAPEVMIRFVGNGLHPSDFTRAQAWIDRLCAWRALGLRRAYLFVHQPDDRQAPELLHHFAALARARGLDVPAVDLAPTPPRQLGLFG